jgi:hypothetical protein
MIKVLIVDGQAVARQSKAHPRNAVDQKDALLLG